MDGMDLLLAYLKDRINYLHKKVEREKGMVRQRTLGKAEGIGNVIGFIEKMHREGIK